MSREAIKQQFKATWLTTSFSLLLFVAVTYFLIWNENRTLQTSVALEEVLQKAVSIDIRMQEEGSQYEGQVVHVVGPLQIMEPLTEPDYNIQVLSVKLKKRVQMYQWIEETSGGETFGDTVVSNPTETHWYHKDWRDYVVDSSLFYLSASHRNPRSIPIASETHIADNVKIGWLSLGLDLKHQVSDYYEITSDVRPEGTDIKLHGGLYYHAESPLKHEVGDLRVRFSYAGRADDIYTAVGLVEGSTLVPYTPQSSPNAEPIALLRKGSSSLQQLLELERREAGASSWKYRTIGGFQVFASAMTLHPQWLTLFLQSRWISSGFRHASRLWVYIVLSVSYTLFVISLPWLFFKPTFALMLLGAAATPLLHYSSILTTRPPDPASPQYRRSAHT